MGQKQIWTCLEKYWEINGLFLWSTGELNWESKMGVCSKRLWIEIYVVVRYLLLSPTRSVASKSTLVLVLMAVQTTSPYPFVKKFSELPWKLVNVVLSSWLDPQLILRFCALLGHLGLLWRVLFWSSNE